MSTSSDNLINIIKEIRFYINPLTNRTIKSDGEVFKDLRKREFKIKKHNCLYNIESAKNCLKHILVKYSNVYPPSSFVNIPLTFNKNKYKLDYIRAFIRDSDKAKKKDVLVGFIVKDGSLYKFKKEIIFDKNQGYPVIQYIDKKGKKKILERLRSEGKDISRKMQKKINKYLYSLEPRCNGINILYNSIQDDFIPVRGDIYKKKLINDINDMLIPNKIRGVLDTSISGIIKSEKDPNKIIGYVDIDNTVKKFEKPIEINFQDFNEKYNEKTPKESKSFSKQLILSESDLPSELELPSELTSSNDLNIIIPKKIFKKIPKLLNYTELSDDIILTNKENDNFTKQLKKICKNYKKCTLDNCVGYDLKWDSKYNKCKKVTKNYK